MSDKPADNLKHPYQALTPDVILDSIESLGMVTDGRFLALNSYENRVYQVGIEAEQPLIVKFYRPNRWTDQAILEEHEYTLGLAALEIPVVAPEVFSDELLPSGRTLHYWQGFRFAIYARHGGRWPELSNMDNLRWMGRFIGRIHAVGAVAQFSNRPTISVDEFGQDAYEYLMQSQFIPLELEKAYESVVKHILQQIKALYPLESAKFIRLHGDCHPGNILWTDSGPHFVDFDDARMGPAIQDLWMLLSGDREDMTRQIAAILEGYSEFATFDPIELNLIESLRSLRMINYSAWLARRWDDPAFPQNFPWFDSNRYWEDHILALKEQLSALQEQPISWS
ncbi:MAG: serine/threonine protein kinase [Thiohalomonadales bacterium]